MMITSRPAKRASRHAFMGMISLSILIGTAFAPVLSAGGVHTVLLEAESFEDYGGWVNDTQVMDQMGSPFLMAHGLGRPVEDAVTHVEFPAAGVYRVLVRTRDWAATFDAPGTPGRFEVHVGGEPLPVEFGTEGAEWAWQEGGTVEIEEAGAEVEIRLHDLTGFNGRCDAIVFTTDAELAPPNEGEEMAWFRRQMLGHPEHPEDSGPYDLVVVGGGMAGICTAVSAARHGLSVALIQDRPVLGGNNSSEVRVGLSGGIHRAPYPRLGDLVDEIGPVGHWNYRDARQKPELPRSREVIAIIERNPEKRTHNAGPASNYEDAKKLEAVQAEENVSLFLNTRVNRVEMDGSRIAAVAGQDTRTGRSIRFSGRWFADCTGDGNVGYLAGADYRYGRESRALTGEPLAPEEPDRKVMGTSVQWYSRQTDEPTGFPETPWAIQFTEETYQKATHGDWNWETGFRWCQINEFEKVRDHGLRAVFGNWSFQKNHSPNKARYANRELDWVAYIGGKRESRRLLGDVILKQQDIVGRREFPDAAVTTTWSIDLHYPTDFQRRHFPGEEFRSRAELVHIRPYPIPYRCFYSRNVDNLFLAGRHISVSRLALGTVRVMRTLGMVGEVVGMAAAVCERHDVDPRQVYTEHLDELKEMMSAGVSAPAFMSTANLARAAEVRVSSSMDTARYPVSHINDGNDSLASNDTRWISDVSMPDSVELFWDSPVEIGAARIVSGHLDSRSLPGDPIETFVLQYHDGDVYRDIEGTATDGNWNTDWRKRFDPVTTDRIRLLVTQTPGNRTRIWELEVYESAPGSAGHSE